MDDRDRAARAHRVQQGAAPYRRERLVNILWTLLALSKLLQLGGIIGGTAVAFSILLPIGGDPLGFMSLPCCPRAIEEILRWDACGCRGELAGDVALRQRLISM